MAILDRFRAQPRQTHSDPAVRLAFVQEIPVEDHELLGQVAREDQDAKVRRAAVAKLTSPAILGAIASADPDENVRAQAVTMLRDIALDAFTNLTEADGLAAVDVIGDQKTLGTVAKTSQREAIASHALSRVTDVHVRGSVARHAQVEGVRRTAFESLTEAADILAVAVNGEFKDTAVAAVERLESSDDLERVATRAKQKSAAKRARGILREREERAAADAAAALAAEQSVRLEAATAAAAVAPPAVDTANAPVPETETPPVEVEAMGEAVPPSEADLAAQRAHEEADAAAREADTEQRRQRLTALAEEAEQGAAEADLPAARRRFGAARRQWKELSAGIEVDPDVAARYVGADARIGARETEARELDARARTEALERLRELLSRVEPLVGRAELSLAAADRGLRDVRAALGNMPALPSKQDYDEVAGRLKALQTALTPRVQELREAADWQRWANVSVQEDLCGKMEALQTVDDLDDVAKQVRALQQQWQRVSNVPRARSETLWRRFKAAHDLAWGRCEAHFAMQATERAENLARKIALCERVEALADSTDWIQTADEIKKIQGEWKTIGPVTRGQEKASWERFRGACDRFFTRRQADLSDRKKVWAENLATKEALCSQVESLAISEDWEATAAQIRQLQAQWKTIGPVRKNRSEAIWQRFRGACDQFFARYAQRHDTARLERVAAREAVCAELEQLATEPPAEGADLLAAVRAIRAKWQQEIAQRGIDREQATALEERFNAAFGGLLTRSPAAFAGTDLDPEANRKRLESLVRRIEEVAASLGPGGSSRVDPALSPTTRLAAMLKEALAANTIGGKVEDQSRVNAAVEEVRLAQANWSRVGAVPEDVRRTLTSRFQRACRRVTEQAGKVAESKGRPTRA